MSNIDNSIKRGMYSSEFAKGRRAAKAGKSRFDCPFNAPGLRDGWFAGFDSVCLEADRAKLIPMTAVKDAHLLA